MDTTPELGSPTENGGVRLARALGIHDAGRALRDFVTYLPTKVLPAVFGFLALPIVARKLDPADLGILAIAQTLVSFGWIAAGQWLTTTINRELPAARARGAIADFNMRLRGGLRVSAVLFVGFSGLVALGTLISPALGRTFPLIVAASFALIVQNLAVTLFQGSLRPRAYMLVEVGSRLAGLTAAVFLVFEGYGIAGYLAGIAVASTLAGAIGVRAGWNGMMRGPAASWSDVRPWLSYGIPASLSSIAVWALLFVDRYLLSLLKNAREVGVYTIGTVLGERPVGLPVLAFAVAATPLLVSTFEGQGREAAERLLGSYTRVLILLTVPIVAFVTVSRRPLLWLLVGTKQSARFYEQATNVVPLVAVASFIGALALFSNAGLSLARRTRLMVLAGLVGLGVNVVSNVGLIPSYGIVGAAISAPIGMTAYLAASRFWSSRFLTWHFPYRTLLRASAAAVAGALAAIPVNHASGWSGVQAPRPELGVLGITAMLGGSVYVLVLIVLGERRT